MKTEYFAWRIYECDPANTMNVTCSNDTAVKNEFLNSIIVDLYQIDLQADFNSNLPRKISANNQVERKLVPR